jgi:hypothetical protein
MCLKEIGVSVQNMMLILGLKVNLIGVVVGGGGNVDGNHHFDIE